MQLRIHYAWVVLILAFFALLSAQGIRLSFGAFITPWEEEFETNRGIISFISFVSYAVFGLSQPYIGRLIDKYGVRKVLSFSLLLVGITTIGTFFATTPWQLMILYGVIASVGFGGASNVVGSVIIANWFVKKRGLALGLMSAGTAAGQLLLVPFSLMLIEQFGWKHTVLLLGSFLIVVVLPLISLFIRTFPFEKGLAAYGEKETVKSKEIHETDEKKEDISIIRLFRTKKFLFLLLPFFACGVTTSGLIDTHLIPFAQVCGFSPALTGTAVSLLAAFNILGTVVSGHLADRLSCKNMLAFLYGGRALSIAVLLIIVHESSLFTFFLSESHLLLLFAISFGIVDFATVAPTVKLATEYFKQLSVGVVIGWLFLSHQIGSAVGSYIPGLLYDITGSYNISFVYSIILLVGAAVLSFLLPKNA